MDVLIFLALAMCLICVVERLDHHLRIRNGPREGDGTDLRWVAPAKDIDPACGRVVTTDKAKASVYDGHVYYFCSRECREVFEAAPQSYLNEGTEHSHA